MHQILSLPGDVYRKLAKGAARRGMTVESLLAAVSELVALPEQVDDRDRRRAVRIEKLLDRSRSGKLSSNDGTELDQLIDADYRAANERADRLIKAKRRKTQNGQSRGKGSRS
jgi:hypothetical protein